MYKPIYTIVAKYHLQRLAITKLASFQPLNNYKLEHRTKSTVFARSDKYPHSDLVHNPPCKCALTNNTITIYRFTLMKQCSINNLTLKTHSKHLYFVFNNCFNTSLFTLKRKSPSISAARIT
jgi:hypothetical protein